MESAWDEIMSEEPINGLIESPRPLAVTYRAATTGAKTAGSVAWHAVEFMPNSRLIDPFRLLPESFRSLATDSQAVVGDFGVGDTHFL